MQAVSEIGKNETKNETKGEAGERRKEKTGIRDIEVFTCKTCGARAVIGSGAVKFPCPYCDELIVRCAKCRRLGREYKSSCGFIGP